MESLDRNSRQAVLLLHGFGASPHWMSLIKRRIARTGRRVISWGYPSWRHSIARHADRLMDKAHELEADATVERIHFVAHSMGSIICRAALLENKSVSKVGRVVMLRPPNRGSHVANFFAPVVGRFVPAIRELSTQPHSFVNGLPRLRNVEVGVIAAGKDRVVGQPNTHLPCQKDHAVVGCGHLPLLFSREVSRMAVDFLEHGCFSPRQQTLPSRHLLHADVA